MTYHRIHRSAESGSCVLRCARLVPLLAAIILTAVADRAAGAIEAKLPNADRIRPYDANPYYWQYKGKPVLLLGGSWQDNLFNHPEGLAEHLDLLVSVGGNYVRNTMSHRDGANLFPFAQEDSGKFDLERFNEAYWERFEHFLELTYERDIIVQIEIFDPHDYYMDRGSNGGWSRQPYNPKNNINYTPEESGLPTEVNYHVAPRPSHHPFFETVPALNDNQRVLAYQIAFVDRMLHHALKYPHVLYTIDNEVGESNAWGDFWAAHVQQRAREAGVTAFTADMRRDHNIRAADHRHMYDRPDLYTFVDISQVTGSRGQSHYDDVLFVRDYIANHPRPINNVKNYGAAKHSEEESIARFFRFLFAGGASTRFHRPHPLESPADHEGATQWGLGLSPKAQRVIRAMRDVDRAFDIFRAAPHNELLADREANEAYLLATPGERYAVYFPAAGAVTLDLSDAIGELRVRRLDIDAVEWRDEGTVSGGGRIEVRAPSASPHGEAAPEDVIVNGSFEHGDIPPAPGYTDAIHGWSLGGGSGHILNDATGPFYTPVIGPIPDGERVYGKQGAGSLSQTIRRPQDGSALKFKCRVNCREGNEGMDLDVRLGEQELWSGTVAPDAGGFQTISYEGAYDASWGTTLAFEFANPQGDATLLVDDVQLWVVPAFGEHCILLIAKE